VLIFRRGKDGESHNHLLLFSHLQLDARDLGFVVTLGRAGGTEQGTLVVDSRVFIVSFPRCALEETRLIGSATEQSSIFCLSLGYFSMSTAGLVGVVGFGDDALRVKSSLVLDSA
jgi:hypothetical protein